MPSQFKILTVAGLCAALLLAAPVRAQSNEELQAAIDLHDAAQNGSRKDVDASLEALKSLAKAHPDNPAVLAYLGSSHALLARVETNPAKKMANVNRGLGYLDEAVNRAPEDFAVRMIRANVEMNLPSMFGRTDDAVADMKALDALFRADPSAQKARPMIPVYEELQRRASGEGDWDSGLALARTAAKE